MTKREIVYYVLDSIKSVNTDSYIVEEHVLFLMNAYRSFLIELKKKLDKLEQLSESYLLEICLDLELVDSIPGIPCQGLYLKSTKPIPTVIDDSLSKVYPFDLFNDIITLVSKERFGFVGYNKYMGNIIYATVGDNHYLYLKSSNPQYKYLEKVRMSGVFEDSDKASELSCECNCEGDCIDILDTEFPIATELIPQMTQFIVKELKQALWTPADDANDSADTIANLMNYIRRNMKTNFQKQIEQ